MTSPESVDLIHRARDGDPEAWAALCERYYPRWLGQFRGEIGTRLRRLCDTEDLVQSAFREAFGQIGDLREEAAFYSWVSAIIRRKIAHKARRAGTLPELLESGEDPEAREDSDIISRLVREDEYLRVLDEIILLFRLYPEAMAVLYLRYFEKLDITSLTEIFGKAERSVHRHLENAREVLRSRLAAG